MKGTLMYTGFVGTGLEDEFLRLVMPVLDRSVRCGEAGRSQGQTRLAKSLFRPFLESWRLGLL